MNKVLHIFLFTLGCTFFIHGVAQVPMVGKPLEKSLLIQGATLHIGNGQVIENGYVGIENGKITYVGATAPSTTFDSTFNAQKTELYPGFIAPNTTLGLREIEAVLASVDDDEVGDFLPNIRSLPAYNAESKITPTVRFNGVLLAETTPRGGVISGTSTVVQLDAWNYQDAVVKPDMAIHCNWPNRYEKTKKPEDAKLAEKKIASMIAFFEAANAYCATNNHTEKNLKYEAMRGLFDGSQTLFVHTQWAKDMLQAINMTQRLGIKKLSIVGGYEAPLIAQELKKHNVSVVVMRPHELPLMNDDATDAPYALAAKLHNAGVLFCINNAGDMEAMNTRNLPFLAGTTAAYELPKEAAVQAITLNAATILGIAKNYGSIEVGKSATLFISTGDALDMRTNNLLLAVIDGRVIVLDSHQKQLYEKYKAKFGM